MIWQRIRRPLIYFASLILIIAVGILTPQLNLLPLRMLPWWPWLWISAAVVVVLVWLVGPRPMYPFSISLGEAIKQGDLTVHNGPVDVRIGKTRRSTLLVGQTARIEGPEARDVEDTTLVTINNHWAHLLNFSDWQFSLNPDVSWKLTLEGSLGNVIANLGELQIRQASVVTDLGDVQIAPPNNGVTSLHISTTIGDIAVRVPEGVAVDVRIEAGTKNLIRLDPNRFEDNGPGRWRSIGYDEAADNRLWLTIETTRGDITIV